MNSRRSCENVVITAKKAQAAGGAAGGAGSADIAAVEDEPVMGDGPLVFGDIGLKVALDSLGSLAVGESQTMGHTEDMGVHCYYRLVVNN